MKQRLVFDATDANTLAASDKVGAVLQTEDGTLLSATGTSLDVNVSNASIAVTATDLDIRDLSSAQDSVEVLQANPDSLNANANIQINDVDVSNGNPVPVSDAGGSITIDATDLDIRDLNSETDSVTVVASQLDIDDLVYTSDSVSSYLFDSVGNGITSRAEDGGQALDVHVTGSGPLTINDAALANTAIVATRNLLDVANTAEDVVASPLIGRKYLFIMNNDNQTAYIGQTGVTATNGFPIAPQFMMTLRAGHSIDIEWVSNKANHDLRTLELS